tara:strand:+ start:884 stop:1045 length:162 start_codon:yes stop_codon:yes gene_type:complete
MGKDADFVSGFSFSDAKRFSVFEQALTCHFIVYKKYYALGVIATSASTCRAEN